MSLGPRMKELREAAGLSQDRIASMVGVSRNAVSQWESDRTQPGTGRLTLIARALNVSVEELLAPSTHLRRRIIITAVAMLCALDAEEVTAEAVCAACGVARQDYDVSFGSQQDLLHEVFCHVERMKLDEVQRAPPLNGTLATRIKYLLRHFLIHDLKHARIARLMYASSWSWGEARERDLAHQVLGVHDLMISFFDEAAAQGQIDPGNYRAASSLLLATYQLGLRKAIFDNSSADRIITFIEPQIAIVLRGFGFRILPGLAED